VPEDRKKKEAEALRANLLKRKAQKRARGGHTKADERSNPMQDGHTDNQLAGESIADAKRRR
jgi:hypothetical protein